MSQYIIDTLGWFLMIGAFCFTLMMLCAAVLMVAPLWMAIGFDREQRHGRMLELMDKQIELEKAMRGNEVSTNPQIEVIGHELPAPTGELLAIVAKGEPDVPAPPA